MEQLPAKSYRMTVSLGIYGDFPFAGNERLELKEEIQVPRAISIGEAAEILTKFSDLAKTVATAERTKNGSIENPRTDQQKL